MQARTVRIATRRSPLALAQANEVRARLEAAHGAGCHRFELHPLTTSGDRIRDRALAGEGGKGLFTKELEEALLANAVDVAVHSMKDVPTWLPPGLSIACVLPREDVRDAFISGKARSLATLASGAVVATSSLRRQAQVRRLRPDCVVVSMRGNVDTRLKKLDAGAADAMLLACAGLKRLGLEARITAPMSVEDMLPAIAQGAIGVEARSDDWTLAELLAPLNDPPTALAVTAERAFLAQLDGSCRMPIAALAELTGDGLTLQGMILSPDGQHCFATRRQGRPEQAILLAQEAARELKERCGPDFLRTLT